MFAPCISFTVALTIGLPLLSFTVPLTMHLVAKVKVFPAPIRLFPARSWPETTTV